MDITDVAFWSDVILLFTGIALLVVGIAKLGSEDKSQERKGKTLVRWAALCICLHWLIETWRHYSHH